MKLKAYRFDMQYGNDPEIFPYYFRAVSAEDVARATGLDVDDIHHISAREISAAQTAGKHVDIVRNGKLIETY